MVEERKVNNRQRVLAVLNYDGYDRLPVVHFGFWKETLEKWAAEGHIGDEQVQDWILGNHRRAGIDTQLGFDCGWGDPYLPGGSDSPLFPPIEEEVVKTYPDGSQEFLNNDGAIVHRKPGLVSIPTEIDHLLNGRSGWEEHFLPRLRLTEERITTGAVRADGVPLPFSQGGLEYLQRGEWEDPYGVFCGSLYGRVRNWVGLRELAYLQVDEPVLFDEIVETTATLCFEMTKALLEKGAKFDYGHFWEDICFKSGPLVNPRLFARKIAPHYRRVTDVLDKYGINIVSLDCDGKIDALIPIWLENGVNTMFPIEVGTWGASIEPWRAEYGRELRGVGGMDKRVLSKDYAAVDLEIERLRPLVDLGGYIPCPDHRIPIDAKWENVQYYCERMRIAFG